MILVLFSGRRLTAYITSMGLLANRRHDWRQAVHTQYSEFRSAVFVKILMIRTF